MNWKRFTRWISVAALSCALALSGCGGGGSKTLSGTVAVGAPIVGALVTVKGKTGNPVTTTTGADGKYRVSVAGLTPPFVIEVTGGTVNGVVNTRALHAVATARGVANVTTFTELLVAGLVDDDPNASFVEWDNLTTEQKDLVLTSGDVSEALSEIKAALLALGVDINSLGDVNTKSFNAVDGDSYDDLLELLQSQLGANDKSFDEFSDEIEAEDDSGGGSNSLTCNPAGFSVPVHAPTSGELSQFAKTYVGDEATDNGQPPPNNVVTVTGTATAVLSNTGAVTYNGTAKAISSICFVPSDNQIVANFTDNTHIDFRANGTMSGVAAISPTLILIQPRALAAYTGSHDLICVNGSLNCTTGTHYSLVITPSGDASINGHSTSGTPTITGTTSNETFIFGTPPNGFIITIQGGVVEGVNDAQTLYTTSGTCGTFCS